MTALTALWLPILLSAVFVFIVSSIIHMTPLWHKNDYPAMPNQDQVSNALRSLAIPPGDYILPRAKDMKEMRTPEFKEKFKAGPVMFMTILANPSMSMARPLTLWFIYILVTNFLVAYVASRALTPGADREMVFCVVGTTAFIGYAAALWQMSIWYGRALSVTIKSTIDGLIYAAVTAGAFVWLWPRVI
ncbi:MAG: hypothetical protein DMF57_15485 [Acidobacteria bacterium]|nr:MAG: hypothetical protein DMF57_15485 [Acidobacteriota bacterium]